MSRIKDIFDNAERIGVIGSPSSTGELTIDILGTAVNKRLVGNLSIFHYIQENKDHYALGQITEIVMENVWTQDPTMRGIIRQKGRVDPITEKQDIHLAKMMVSSVFCKDHDGLKPSIFGTVPSTGTSIRLLDENIMNALLFDYKNEIFYLGMAYGTNIKMPTWLKHFGSSSFGSGEAYHIGIFGKTGSGKSVLAKMMMLGYARHKEMTIFVLDPQGDFTKDFRQNPQIKKISEKLGREVKIFHISNLVLDDSNLFVKILARSKFWEGLVRSHDYRIRAGEILLEYIKRKKKNNKTNPNNRKNKINNHIFKSKKEAIPQIQKDNIKISQYYKKEIFDNIVWNILKDDSFRNRIYSKKYAQEFKETIESSSPDEFYRRWAQVAKLFTWYGREKTAITINRLIKDMVFIFEKEKRPFIVIDLSKEDVPEDFLWNEEIQTLTIKRILDRLTQIAEQYYKQNRLLNCLVVIDEAHRFAPRERIEDESLNTVKNVLIDAIRTTRKYGLGWMFISQTLSSLSKEIINQIRIYVFGFGLGWGIERRALREIIGGAEEAIRLYQNFKDPQSSLGEKEYPFMTIGPISPLSFSGTPLFFTALKYPDEFLKINFREDNEDK
ncbi:MAG: ATP-binding protein [Candidatus Helarchaeota archaeon]